MSSPFDAPLVRNSTLLRKLLANSLVSLAALGRPFCTTSDYRASPPLIVNSLPKSGTHLLLQIARSLPDARYLGRFIATTPSLTLRERSPHEIASRIRKLLPGEVVGAHIYHSPEVVDAIEEINGIHLFIYRDPRDVLLSEVHYLSSMNRWHRMHRVFANLTDPQARLRLAISGYDGRYPSCEQRIQPYLQWTGDPNTFSVRYEDLVGQEQHSQLRRLADVLIARGNTTPRSDLVKRLQSGINPHASHTFHTGGTEKWRLGYNEDTLSAANARLHPILVALGYSDAE